MGQQDEFASYGSGSGANGPDQSPSSFVGFDRYFSTNAQTAKASGDAVAAQVKAQADQVKNQFDQASQQYRKGAQTGGVWRPGKTSGATGAADASVYQQQLSGLSAPTTGSLQSTFEKQNANVGGYSPAMSAWDAALVGRASPDAFAKTSDQLKGLSDYFNAETQSANQYAKAQKAQADQASAQFNKAVNLQETRDREAARLEAERVEQERQARIAAAREGTDPDERTTGMSPEAWAAATGRPIEEY